MNYRHVRELARENRKNPTPAENFFWHKVRNRRFSGRKFTRQFIIRYMHDHGFWQYFIVDFYCHRHRLVIELDGKIHESQKAEDTWRESKLRELGYRVLRFKNEDVLTKWPWVKERLRQEIMR